MYFFSPVPIIKVLILLVCPLKRIHDMNVKIFVILIIFFILLSLRGVLRLCIFPSSILHDSKITRQYNDIMFLYKFLSKYQTTINNNNNNKNTPNENVLIILEINPKVYFHNSAALSRSKNKHFSSPIIKTHETWFFLFLPRGECFKSLRSNSPSSSTLQVNYNALEKITQTRLKLKETDWTRSFYMEV